MTRRPVTVVGAGFSGLTAAYYLDKAGYAVELIERAAVPGGLISTKRTPWGLVETAANGALNSLLLEALAADLGVRIAFPGPRARKRYVFRGRPRRFPLTLAELPGVAGFIANFALNREAVRPRADETIRRWATRVGGNGFARYLVEAATQGIYSGDPERLSASLIVGRFFDRNSSKVQRPSRRGTVAPEMGMGELIEALRVRLQQRGVVCRYETSFRCGDASPAHPHVIAAGAAASAEIVAPASAELAAALNSFEVSGIITATVFFREKSLEGFGCLFPKSEQRPVLGVLIPTDIFPNRSREFVAETWMLGGASGASAADPAELLRLDDEEILAIILRERERAFGKSATPVGHLVTRWPHAIPHYTIELERALPRLVQGDRNIFLHGNYLGQIGLAKILERAAALPDEIGRRGEWR